MESIITPNLVPVATTLAAAGSSSPAAAERIENLVRRTCQYVAMYNVINRISTKQRAGRYLLQK